MIDDDFQQLCESLPGVKSHKIPSKSHQNPIKIPSKSHETTVKPPFFGDNDHHQRSQAQHEADQRGPQRGDRTGPGAAAAGGRAGATQIEVWQLWQEAIKLWHFMNIYEF